MEIKYEKLTLTSLKFEEEGTVTTIVGRGFVNKLLPKK